MGPVDALRKQLPTRLFWLACCGSLLDQLGRSNASPLVIASCAIPSRTRYICAMRPNSNTSKPIRRQQPRNDDCVGAAPFAAASRDFRREPIDQSRSYGPRHSSISITAHSGAARAARRAPFARPPLQFGAGDRGQRIQLLQFLGARRCVIARYQPSRRRPHWCGWKTAAVAMPRPRVRFTPASRSSRSAPPSSPRPSRTCAGRQTRDIFARADRFRRFPAPRTASGSLGACPLAGASKTPNPRQRRRALVLVIHLAHRGSARAAGRVHEIL